MTKHPRTHASSRRLQPLVDDNAQLLQETFEAAQRLEQTHNVGAVNVEEDNPKAQSEWGGGDRVVSTGGVARWQQVWSAQGRRRVRDGRGDPRTGPL